MAGKKKKNKTHIGVLGGGVAGLTAAYELLKKGFAVTVIEQHGSLGGMAKTIEVEGVPLEIYYHHAFKSDASLWRLCEELGISDKIRWLKSTMGYLTGGKTYEFGTAASLLKFKPLGLFDKLRFGASTLLMSRKKDVEAMEKYTADEWLRRYAGDRVYKIIWRPLLRQKFADDYDKISITFLSRRIQLRNETRRLGSEEALAYIDGSFGLVVSELARRIEEMGGRIIKSAKIEKIVKNGGGLLIKTGSGDFRFDTALATFAPEVLDGLCDFPDAFREGLKKLEHTGALVAVLVMKKPLTDIYWLNVGDESFPFGAVVEHTNFWGPEHYNGRHILYISKYLRRDDPLFLAKNEKVLEIFFRHLKRLNSGFDEKTDVIRTMVFKEKYAQPIVKTNFSRIKPGFKTPVDGLYWISTSHIYPEDRGVNYSIRSALEVSEAISSENRS